MVYLSKQPPLPNHDIKVKILWYWTYGHLKFHVNTPNFTKMSSPKLYVSMKIHAFFNRLLNWNQLFKTKLEQFCLGFHMSPMNTLQLVTTFLLFIIIPHNTSLLSIVALLKKYRAWELMKLFSRAWGLLWELGNSKYRTSEICKVRALNSSSSGNVGL